MSTTPKYSRLAPGSGANRSSTRPTRCSPSAATTRSRSRTSPAPPASPGGWCTTTSAAAKRSTSRCSSGSAPCARNNSRRPSAAAPARVWPTACRAGSTGPSRTARSGSPRSGAARTSPTPTSGPSSSTSSRRAVALVAAHHADIADDSPRLRYALECWTGTQPLRHPPLATRRGRRPQRAKDATNWLAAALACVLRTGARARRPRPDSRWREGARTGSRHRPGGRRARPGPGVSGASTAAGQTFRSRTRERRITLVPAARAALELATRHRGHRPCGTVQLAFRNKQRQAGSPRRR